MKKLITNSKSDNFYNQITSLLSTCKSFYINAAFINYSGLQLLLDSFKSCEKKEVKGKILTSTYLSFTQPKALEKLKEFKNISTRVFHSENQGFHSKAYIFEFEDFYKVIIGSSNITASAFKSNIEWNLKVFSKKDEEFIIDILEQFHKLFDNSFELDKTFLQTYKDIYEENKSLTKKNFSFTLSANSMQKKALESLSFLRLKGENKALCICATGTGKTYLSAFDIKNCNAKKVLFLAHRENILNASLKSYEKIFKNSHKMGVLSYKRKDLGSDFLFSTVQSMSKNLDNFKKDDFDYIVFDEAHHIKSNSYEKIQNYFEAKFTLGLTATPNRSDEKSIYENFDDNVAIDLRLNDSLNYGLIAPFHYFGISDIKVDFNGLDLNDIAKISALLQINKRVDFIINKLNFYGFDGKKRKALGFCIDKKHGKFMANKFNEKGLNSIFLSSEDSVEKREKYIKNLEDDKESLQYIFSVDIFNEGIDIPSVNTILMLRPTNSSIVFTQQLGRGLRKSKAKNYLTVLDFIGNHNKAYLVTLALLGDRIIDKDSIKVSLKNKFAAILNDTFICMDEISKQRILEQLEKENFSSILYLKQNYFDFKNIIKKIPSMLDFYNYENSINPKNFIDESKSLVEFIQRVEKIDLNFCEKTINILRFLQGHIPLKRVHEFVIIKELLTKNSVSVDYIYNHLQKYQEKVSKQTILHSFRYLNQEFFDIAYKKRFLKIFSLKNEVLVKEDFFTKLLEEKRVKELFLDTLEYGILLYEKEYSNKYYGLPFLKLYAKYNMKNIALVCNLDKIHSSFRGSGQLKYKNDYFLFINLDKQNAIKSRRYTNIFYDRSTFSWQSKPNASQNKGDGYNLINHKTLGINLHIFVRKFVSVDKKTQSFVYLGLANVKSFVKEKPINFTLTLEKRIPKELFDEFI